MEDAPAIGYGTFASRLGQLFVLRTDSGQLVELTVVHVAGADGQSKTEDGRPFSVLFHGPLTPVLPQRTYALTHQDMGEIAVFLVPLGPQAAAMRYEAVFN